MRKLLILLVITTQLLLSTNLVFGQEAQKNKIVSFSDFSGGLATKLSDQSTNPKYARIAENVRLNSSFKSITKRNQLYLYGTAHPTEPITSLHRLYLKDLSKKFIVTAGNQLKVGDDSTGLFTNLLTLGIGERRFEWVTWHDLAIGGDGYNSTIKTNGSDATYLGALYAEVTGTAGGPVAGTPTYKVSCHAENYSIGFDQVSNSVTANSNDIDLSMIPIGPDTILGEDILWRKVYRNKAAVPGTWYLLSNGKISNNTAVTLTDSDIDGALGAETYPTCDETWTPPKGKHLLIHKNRLWVANNPDYPSRLYYSEDGSHDLFDPLGYFNVRNNDGDEITFIKNLLGLLTIGKTNTIQKAYTNGDDPDADWEISDPFSFIGCDAPHSAVNTPIGIMYLSRSKTGIYVFNGQNSILKSEAITPVIQDILTSNLESVWGEYNNNIYYMAYPSSTVGGAVNNRLLVCDMLSNAYTIDTLSLNCLTSFTGSSDGGDLYGGSSLDGKVFSFTIADQTIKHNTFEDFTGTWAHSRYIPEEVGGDSTSPILEIAWSNTVDESTGSIDALLGDVNRSTGGGTYISPIMNTTGASTYDKIFWNEILPAGCNATFAIRTGSSHVNCHAAAWSGEYSVATGSDISAITPNNYTQYRITLSSSDIDYTPNINTLSGYTVKLAYNKLGTPAETAISLHWQTGFLDMGLPGYTKTLRKIVVYHEGENGELKITVTNERGNTDSWDINLGTNPTLYSEYTTTGAFLFEKIRMDLQNSDLNSLIIKEIIFVLDVEPIV